MFSITFVLNLYILQSEGNIDVELNDFSCFTFSWETQLNSPNIALGSVCFVRDMKGSY